MVDTRSPSPKIEAATELGIIAPQKGGQRSQKKKANRGKFQKGT